MPLFLTKLDFWRFTLLQIYEIKLIVRKVNMHLAIILENNVEDLGVDWYLEARGRNTSIIINK